MPKPKQQNRYFTGTTAKPMLRLLSLLFFTYLYTARHNIGIMVSYLIFTIINVNVIVLLHLFTTSFLKIFSWF